MKTLAGILCLFAVFALQWVLIVNFSPTQVRVDCGMASFHPDYTTAMREACRQHIKNK